MKKLEKSRPKKTWRDCVKDDMESLDLYQKDTQFRKNAEGELRGNRLTQAGLPGKWALKGVRHITIKQWTAATLANNENHAATYLWTYKHKYDWENSK